jgi:DNA-binding Lrp family transcriptional regulator
MDKTNERTLQMMKAYVELHDQGFSVAEIAKRFNLSETTVYARLEEIAEHAGLTRHELLISPLRGNHSSCNFKPIRPVDAIRFQDHHDTVMSELDALKRSAADSIEELEVVHEILKEEL